MKIADTYTSTSGSSQDSLETTDESSSIYAEELALIQELEAPSLEEIKQKEIYLGIREEKYTLVIDLDETLVLSTQINDDSEEGCKFRVKIRPFLQNFFETIKGKFEMVVFTASDKKYAERVVEIIDKHHQYIKKVVSRENCIQAAHEILVKDLRIFADRKASELVIVDNSILSFAFQLESGIPITSFQGNDDDEELSYLADYLEMLYNENDLITANKKLTGLVLV